MVGVTVTVQSGSRILTGISTDANGKYTLRATEGEVLVFSFVGYLSQEIAYTGQSVVNVRMRTDAVDLESVVVIGYGTQRKIDLTGSVAVLSGEALTQMPAPDLFKTMAGKVAGMQIINDSEPGAAPTVRIRGIGSYGDPTPICVIDGQFFEMEDLAMLNPNDIESISVLKDASATAIYGSRGANGVVIVTTKIGSGEKNRVRVNAGAYYSTERMQRYLPTGSASDFQRYRNMEYLANNYADPDAGNSLPYPDWQSAGKGTDWQRLISRIAHSQNYNISLGGNTTRASYYFSASLLNQEGVVKYTNYDRFTGKFNGSFDLYKWLKLGINSTYIYDNQVAMDKNILELAGKRSPSASVFVNPDEEEIEDNFSGGDNNPYALLYYTHDRYKKTLRFLTNVWAESTLTKGLVLRTSFSSTNVSREEKIFLPAFMENVTNSSSAYRRSRFYHNTDINGSWLQENTLTYSLSNSCHRLSVMGGLTFQSLKTQYNNLNANDLPWSAWKNRNLWYVGQGQNISGSDGGTDKSYMSYLGRLTYTCKDRYTATLTGRADGSSGYPADNRWGFFPSAGVAWIASHEEFLRDVRWIDLLKVRASYGVVGNDKGVKEAQTLYADSQNVIMGPDQTVYSASALRLRFDDALTWEETRTLNTGFEVTILRNLFSLSAEVYDKRTSKVMMPLNIPPSNTRVIYNIGSLENRGLELSLSVNPKQKEFSANILGTATFNQNRVTRINRNIGPIASYPNLTTVGYPIGGLWGYRTLGVFQNEDQLAWMPSISGATVGELIFSDENGDGMIDESDYIYLGSYMPKMFFGLSCTFQYKGFSLSFDLNSALGHKSFNRRMQYRQNEQNIMTGALNAWTAPGSTNDYPKPFDRNGTSARISDFFIEDCSYLDLTHVQLAYHFPKKWLKPIGFNTLRIYVTGSNLVTLTNSTGYRPDFSPRGSDANNGGIDYFNQYPNNRTFTVGISFNL